MKHGMIRKLFSLSLLGVLALSSTACQWDEVDPDTGELTVSYYTPLGPGVGMLECNSKDGKSWHSFGYLAGLAGINRTQLNVKHPANPVYGMTIKLNDFLWRILNHSQCSPASSTKVAWWSGNFWDNSNVLWTGDFYQKRSSYIKYKSRVRVSIAEVNTIFTPQTLYFTDAERKCFDKHSSSNLWTRALDCNTDKSKYFVVEDRTDTITETINRGPVCKAAPTGRGLVSGQNSLTECRTICATSPEWTSTYYPDETRFWSESKSCGFSDDGDEFWLPIPVGAICENINC